MTTQEQHHLGAIDSLRSIAAIGHLSTAPHPQQARNPKLGRN